VKTEKLVLAFYYAWYGTPEGPHGKWVHWNHPILARGGVLGYHNPDRVIDGRRDIAAAEYPLLGPYDSLDPEVIETHLKWAQDYGVDCFIVSWWGREKDEDKVLEKMMNIIEEKGYSVKVSAYYETVGLKRDVNEMTDDFKYILEKHAYRESFLKIGKRPVIFVYSAEVLEKSFWKIILSYLRSSEIEPFIIGDTRDPAYAEIFDGIHVYIPLKEAKDSSGTALRRLYSRLKNISRTKGKLFAATVLPGYDDRVIRIPGNYLPRKRGQVYELCWKIALEHSPEWIIITSWNEWHEGTEIEPSKEYGFMYLEFTKKFSEEFKKSGL